MLAQDVRRPRVLTGLRQDPNVRLLAERLIRDPENRDIMVRIVQEALDRCIPLDTVSERFAELVTHGVLVLRERSQDFYPLPDPNSQPAVDLGERAANQPEPLAAPAKSAPALAQPPTAAELGFTSDSIPDRARAQELADVVAHYSNPSIREDVRQRLWADIRRDPNRLATMKFFIGEATPLPTPEELESAAELSDKSREGVTDVLKEVLDKIGNKMRGVGR